MDTLTDNQLFHLILADIAMAAATRTHDAAGTVAMGDYRPGGIRDIWLDRTTDPDLRQKVTALASAALASLQAQPGEQLAAIAARYGIPLTADLAERIAGHFDSRRNAVLTYDR